MSRARAARDEDRAARTTAGPPVAERSPADAILAAQRAAGNRATRAMMRRESAPPRGARVLARRRIPAAPELEKILFDPAVGGHVDAADAAAHRAGLERLIAMSRQ